METIRTFEDLECWRACRQLRLFVSQTICPAFPKNEQYGLDSQIKRAARSTTANIAEGFGRYHFRDNYKFCSNARGSLYEVLDHLLTARDEGFIQEETLAEGRKLFEKAKGLLNGYMNYLSRSANSSSNLREESAEYLAGTPDPTHNV